MERQRSFLFFSFLFFSCEQQQASNAIELAPTEQLETISKAEYLKLRDERLSEIKNESLGIIDGNGNNDNPLDGTCIDLDPVEPEVPVFCDCTLQILDVSLPNLPPNFNQNLFDFQAIENCIQSCNVFENINYRSEGECFPIGANPICNLNFSEINDIIDMGEIPFLCGIAIFNEFNVLFSAFHDGCPANTSIGTMLPTASITFVVKCQGNTPFNADCVDFNPTGPSFGTTGPVTIDLGGLIDKTVKISLEGECGCDPVATQL